MKQYKNILICDIFHMKIIMKSNYLHLKISTNNIVLRLNKAKSYLPALMLRLDNRLGRIVHSLAHLIDAILK